MRFFLLLFILVPLAEMLLLFAVADYIGGLWTVGLVVLTAVAGIRILKRQGLRTLSRARQRMESGELPAREIVEGMLIAAAGAMLLTPGFITDTLGFTFLTPFLRGPIAAWLLSRGVWSVRMNAPGSFDPGQPRQNGNVYEGEYSRGSPQGSRLDDSRQD